MNTNMTKQCLALLAASALVGALAACGSSGDDNGADSGGKGAIKLGQSTSMTGALAATCVPPKKGLDAMIKNINDKGGIDGRKVTLTTLDDAGNASKAVANVRQFTSDGVAAVVGGCGSTAAGAMGPALNRAKVPYLFPDASVPALAEPVKKYVFNLIPQYQEELAGLTKAAMKKFGPGTNYAWVQQIPGADTIIDSVTQATKDAGGTMAGSQQIPAAPTDVSPYVLKYSKAKSDYIAIAESAADANRVVKAMAQRGVLPKHILGFHGFNSDVYLQGLPLAVQKATLVATSMAPVGTPQASECSDIMKKYQVPVNGFTLVGCAQGLALEAALKAAKGDYSADGIVKGLESMNNVDVGSLIGPLSFSSTDHVGIGQEFMLEIKDGKLVVAGKFSDL